MTVLKRDADYHTYSDYLTWSRDYGDELINGTAYVREPPSPSQSHQQIVVELCRQAANALEDKPCDVYAAGFAFECIRCLAIELTDNLLVRPRGGRRLSDIGGTIDQLIAVSAGPREVVAVGVVVRVALEYRHSPASPCLTRFVVSELLFSRSSHAGATLSARSEYPVSSVDPCSIYTVLQTLTSDV